MSASSSWRALASTIIDTCCFPLDDMLDDYSDGDGGIAKVIAMGMNVFNPCSSQLFFGTTIVPRGMVRSAQ
eukprot:scaffold740_cov246-Chaetoceros_neogracile.AAC.10